MANDRAAKIAKDPRFRRPKKKDTKVKIDSRFASMMTDSMFEGSEAGSKRVDKYGRKKDISTRKSVDLKRFYRLDDDDQNEKEETPAVKDEEDDLELSEVSDADMDHERMALIARGELVLSSEEDEEDDAKLEDGIFKLDQGQLEIVDEEDFEDVLDTEDVPKGEPSKRFAVVNMDWDNIKALDIFKVMEAFKPATGSVQSVHIYPSEFGKERMEKENKFGPPPEIFESGKKSSSAADNEDVKSDNGDEELNHEALRKYQLERLRYYYAVVECDSVRTATAIFDQCDGSEYERSSVFFDLRYIPDEMDFSQDEVKDEANEVPITYQPREFVTHVLQHSNPKLTWDEDDPVRLKVTKHKFTKDDLKSMDFQTYLASGSEASDSEDEDALRKKYKTLLQNADGNVFEDAKLEDEDDQQENMEITFTPGLSSNISKMLDKKKSEDDNKDETVFETMMRKRKEKRKELRKQQQEAQDQEESDGNYSDLENDPFFRDELQKRAKEEGKSKSSKRKTKLPETPEADAELDLLLMEDEVDEDGNIVKQGRHHFDYDEITKAQKKKGKKSKKREQTESVPEDDFKIDTRDPRFDALFTSSQFALDPTSSKFRKTEAMSTILDERKKRNRRNSIHVENLERAPVAPQHDIDNERKQEKQQLKHMVDRIKMRK